MYRVIVMIKSPNRNEKYKNKISEKLKDSKFKSEVE